jgi:hypothetical protein
MIVVVVRDYHVNLGDRSEEKKEWQDGSVISHEYIDRHMQF